MAVVNSSTFNFSEVFHTMLANYGSEAASVAVEAIEEVAKETVTKLKQESASKFGNGDYAKGWTKKSEKKRLNTVITIYGKKPTYALAHLLENPHAKRGGGRTTGNPHIAPINDWAQDEAFDRTISKLEKL